MGIITKRNIPNIITVLRLLLLIPIAYTLLEAKYRWAFGFFFLAGISDGLDGFLARYFQWTSKFGAFADPLADKLLMLVTFSCLAWMGRIPMWLFIIVIGRDLWIMAGATFYRVVISNFEFKPTLISKFNTFFQIVLVVAMLFDAAFMKLPGIVTQTLIYIVLITTISSLIDYTWGWGRRALINLGLHCL